MDKQLAQRDAQWSVQYLLMQQRELCATNNCNLLTSSTARRENCNCNFARRDAPHVARII